MTQASPSRRGLVWFEQDLRLHDNPALHAASHDCDALVYLFCVDPDWWQPRHWQCRRMSTHRARFLAESLNKLNTSLQTRDRALCVLDGPVIVSLEKVIQQFTISDIYCNLTGSVYQTQMLALLRKQFPHLRIHTHDGDVLWKTQQLPFALNDLPAHYTPFRKQVETLDIDSPLPVPERLPPALHGAQHSMVLSQYESTNIQRSPFDGGADAATEHLQWYFSGDRAARYTETRNALDGWENSSKFSPWLALGTLSAKQIVLALRHYEAEHGANESTYWIFFELLWREYFKWYARRHGKHLFRFRGLAASPPLTSFYPERFRAWSEGTTPYPIVNACMRQLNETGYMSNRGRQLVASCLIHELKLDWRYGAAYFEQQLIDYDVASNWGNWQYIAGVGADPRGGRHFNLSKQAERYDPEGRFVQHWKGQEHAGPADSRDAADWPIMSDDT